MRVLLINDNRLASFPNNFDDEFSNLAVGSYPATSTVDRFVSISNAPIERHIITRSPKGNFKPNPKSALTTIYSSLNESKTLKEALQHPLWVEAMRYELQALEKIILGSWLLKHLI